MISDRKLDSLSRYGDWSLLVLRAMTGIFLVYGVWDNIVDPKRMEEFIAFVRQHGFPAPGIAAPFSIGVQFLCGLAFILGLFTRSFALLCAVHFIIALWMVHWNQDLRAWWPALALVGIGALLATHGPGRYALDTWLRRGGQTGG